MPCQLVRCLPSFSNGVPEVRPSGLIISRAEWIQRYLAMQIWWKRSTMPWQLSARMTALVPFWWRAHPKPSALVCSL